MKLKIVFIQPPIQDFYNTKIRLQPLGLAYLKSSILRKFPGTHIIIRDYHHGYPKKTIPIPKELDYLKHFFAGYDKGPFSSFHQYYHFGASFPDIVSDLKTLKPDLIGISSSFSPYYEEVLTLASQIKNKMNIPIILGGAHVSACPELMLKNENVDFVIVGEGEKAICLFLKEFLNDKNYKKVPSLGYKKNEELFFNPQCDNFHIDEIPFPDFSDFPTDRYQYNKKTLSFIQTSRSCPWQCDFCSVHTTFGKKFRQRKSDQVIEEMKSGYLKGVRIFDFEDDNLTFNKTRALELFEKIKINFPKKDIELMAMNGLAYQSMDKEILVSMKEAGFKNLNIALVFCNEKLAIANSRPHSPDKFRTIVNDAFDMNYFITAYLILGHPEDNITNMIDTLAMLASLPVLIGASMFYLTPSSPIEKRFPIQNTAEIKRSRLTAMEIHSKKFSREQIFTMFIATRIINFLKGLDFQTTDINLSSLIKNPPSNEKRSMTGIRQLAHIFETGKHILIGKKEILELDVFDFEIFKKVMARLPEIYTQNGKKILNDIDC
ncbi:MAG: B12-binding domain-containing radical SAM protein [Bacteriovoracaceae bacterium]|nr:B12-binding domain-containing radical SAM protein [Bacteriovoracaceae bacterium]